ADETADLLEEAEGRRDVGDARQAADRAALARQQRREEERQPGVLRAADRHGAGEPPASPHDDLRHDAAPSAAGTAVAPPTTRAIPARSANEATSRKPAAVKRAATSAACPAPTSQK